MWEGGVGGYLKKVNSLTYKLQKASGLGYGADLWLEEEMCREA